MTNLQEIQDLMKVPYAFPEIPAVLSTIPSLHAKPVAEKVSELCQEFLKQLVHVVIVG